MYSSDFTRGAAAERRLFRTSEKIARLQPCGRSKRLISFVVAVMKMSTLIYADWMCRALCNRFCRFDKQEYLV